MAEVPAPPADLFDESGTLIADVLCRRCGYNLRGLPGAGHCPECGTPVGRSTLGDLLQFSDPQWLEGLARGANLVLWGMVVVILGSLAESMLPGLGVPPAAASLLGLMGMVLGWYGTWLLTEPDPSRIGEDAYGRARRFVRFSLLVGVLSQGVGLLIQVLVIPRSLVILLGLAAGVAGLIGLVGWFYQLVYLEKLAMRIPDLALARRARGLRWTLVIIVLLGLALFGGALLLWGSLTVGVGAPVAPGGPGGGPAASLACSVGMLMLVSLIAMLFYVRMIWRFRNALRQKAADARGIWQGGPGEPGPAAALRE